MKNVFYSLICLLGLASCASENTVVDAMKVYEVNHSECKKTVTVTETRSNYLEDFKKTNATLELTLGKDGVVTGVFENVRAGCVIDKMIVEGTSNGDGFVLYVYPQYPSGENMVKCLCLYDVGFKMNKVLPGTYNLVVYNTSPANASTLPKAFYTGMITLEYYKTIKINMNY